MTGLVPTFVVRGVSAADGNARRLPITRYDQMLAALGTEVDALQLAYWAGDLVAGTVLPRNLIDGTYGSTFNGAAYTIIAEDNVLGFHDSSGAFVGLPCFNFQDTGAFRNGQLTGKYTQSWSIAAIVVPDAGGNGGIAYGIDAANSNGGSVRTSGALVYMDTYHNSGIFTSVPRARLIDGQPNIIVACADAVTRQHALYVNSKTPALSAAGIGANPWRDLGGNGDWGFGASPGDSFKGRAHSFAAFKKSLHHDPACYTRLLKLIDAAASTFGIALV